MSSVDKKVILESNEEDETKRRRFSVDLDIALCSELVKEMLNLEGSGGLDDDNVIPLPNVTAPILEKIVHWATENYSEKEPAELTAWNEEFLQMENATLFDVVRAANYMDIKPLLDLLTSHIASMMKGKEPADIRRIFIIKDDIGDESPKPQPLESETDS